MPANLTRPYIDAEQEYKKAQTPEEKLACLKRMYSLIPKHKSTEKLQADIKTKMRKTKEEMESDKKAGRKGGDARHRIPRQGAGQCVLLGGANSGKSSLLNKLTRATADVAPYPFTTVNPQPAMMSWEDARVQLIDLPPVTPDYMEGFVSSLTRTTDVVLLMVDLSTDDGPIAVQEVIDRVAQTKTYLVGTPPTDNDDLALKHVKTMLIANKIDAPEADIRLELLREEYGSNYPIHPISVEAGTGVEELRTAIYQSLNVIRVYTKQPGKTADIKEPYTLPAGSTLDNLAYVVHADFAEKLKFAKIWGTDVYDGQTIKRDHILHDKDIVELHI